MANKAKHAFGSSDAVLQALQDGKINSRDILFLDEDTDNPKVGWITKSGEVVIVKSDTSDIETELDTKVDATEVETMINEKIAEVNASYEIVEF